MVDIGTDPVRKTYVGAEICQNRIRPDAKSTLVTALLPPARGPRGSVEKKGALMAVDFAKDGDGVL